ncbi:glycosyltransferase family 61 protein [Runella sp.]|uniref:glycosyltransferase family 61 protein n=1 Tax=Runella sp. TaxID=1960881 RepID=UPI003D0CF158
MKPYTKNKVPGHSGIVIAQELESTDKQEMTVDFNKINPDGSVTLTQSGQSAGFLSWSTYPKIIRESLAAIRWLILTKGAQWVSFPFRFLSKSQTEAYLQSGQLVLYPANLVLLHEAVDLLDSEKQYFSQNLANNEPVRVWSYLPGKAGTKQLPYGGVVINNKVLCNDTDHHDFYRNVRHRRKRTELHAKILIAPWSHFQDGFIWGGYYDYLILLVGKLCRIKDVLPEADFKEAIVSYPLFNTPYEHEYLLLLGIEPERVVDSRTHQITFDRCILGDIGHWFYPNAADIALIRKYILEKVPETDPYAGNRIYISRAGRRHILNEKELVGVLKNHGFQIIEDVPRTIAEQVSIYRNARFIIGPHGASFSNILWCRPGTYLFELFSATYVPEHFHYLAELLQLRYTAYYYGTADVENDHQSDGLEDSIYVDITEIEQSLQKLLNS